MNTSGRTSLVGAKTALLVAALAGGLALSSVDVPAAQATPGQQTACTECHGSGASGTVTAVPSTATPAAGAAYTVAIMAPVGPAGGDSGFWVAKSDAQGATGATTGVRGGPTNNRAFTATMTAPATAGTYYYKVWAVTGPDDSSGVTNSALYSITVAATPPTPTPTPTPPTPTPTPPAPTPPAPTSTPTDPTPSSPPSSTPTPSTPPTTTPAPRPAAPRVARLTPARGRVGATVTILGKGFGRGGVVSFAAVRARVTSWSATRIVVKVPRLAARRQPVTVTPRGARRSNVMMFTVLRGR